MAKPKVLFVATTFPLSVQGNDLHFMRSLAEGLSAECDIHVLAPHAPGAPWHEVKGNLYVHRFIYGLPFMEQLAYGSGIMHNLRANRLLWFMVPLFFSSAMVWALVLIIRHRIASVHVNWIIPFGPLFAASRPLLRFRLLITALGADLLDVPHSTSTGGSVMHRAMRAALAQADAVTVLSSPMKERVNVLMGNDCHVQTEVIPLGIDLSRFSAPNYRAAQNAPMRLLFVGRLVEVKGCDILIEALREVHLKQVPFSCTIAGDGHDRMLLERRCTELGLNGQVGFLGHVQNAEIPDLMAQHDVFVVPSRREAFGVVYLEAMASGLSIVSTTTDGQHDMIIDEYNGLVVTQESAHDIAEAIITLHNQPDKRRMLAANARAVAVEYSWEAVIERYRGVYRRIVKGQSGSDLDH